MLLIMITDKFLLKNNKRIASRDFAPKQSANTLWVII